ncbi:MAG: ABC transporter ATP-binding protein [Oceanospirillaceae bacterium]|uniref:ABC transporter ATP-binding protein n=1 Tax=unclassified Thalassolituus TaxID=2624967 RepID=UPI000C4F8572|nr:MULTISPECIES: dipeptide ABC transporter ATP-binding protein [unclassified Thalassolituus]MAS24033.1 ABC transporter ATP-binding protein [Oceanospirillaceae bacterium]MBL33564.1 ABC transporter ATP-binding protein [Oceanospirillaceae bacterium]MBS53141.1 ABC transporter ATP-binding protein [Oceanospirillaceae bacterium]
MTDNQPLLSVRELSVDLLGKAGKTVDTRLVNQISFDIHAGEVLALVGESGSGKSLTALAIMRLLPDVLAISGGHVTLSGTDIFALTEARMNAVRGRKVAMVFQEPQSALNAVQTVGQQIGEVLNLHKKLSAAALKQQIISLLTEVGIPDPQQRLDWYPHQLSGGQKQRVMIAMALACEPDLLIADEPTTALDVTIQKQILELLNELRHRRQLGILLITHDMGVVAEMADSVVIMRHGEILEASPAGRFFSDPQHEYSRMLIHSLPDRTHFLSSGDGDALLELKDVKVWFAQRRGVLQRIASYTRAVDGISLKIGRGETLALVGESGSGKSTAGKAILSMEPLAAGEIYFAGQRIDQLTQKNFRPLRKKIQVIFQDPFSSMNPRMSVREILEEGMVSLGVEKNAAERESTLCQLMEKVGLEASHLDRFSHEFSGGQRQRLAIARAIAVEPELIICDEPTSALDVSIRGQVLELLHQLQQEMGLSYLFITHDLSIIPHIAHKLAVMKNGVLVEQGATADIMQNPQHEYTRALLAAVPDVPACNEANITG